MVRQKDYLIKIGTAKVPVAIEEINRVIDASTLESINGKDRIERNDVGECVLKLGKAVGFDLFDDIASTGRFVIIDDYEISGGGIILEHLKDEQSWVRDRLFLRDYKWEQSSISQERRAEKYNQKSTLILVTGEKDSGKKPFAKRLEQRLFEDGKLVYFLGMGNILYGVDSDIQGRKNRRQEHLRRLAEVAHIMLEAGMILLVTAIELTGEDLELIKTVVNPDCIETIWIGDRVTTDIPYDIRIVFNEDAGESVTVAKELLQEKGIIFKP
jgi:bifunctional enzyme CysN/CysC